MEQQHPDAEEPARRRVWSPVHFEIGQSPLTLILRLSSTLRPLLLPPPLPTDGFGEAVAEAAAPSAGVAIPSYESSLGASQSGAFAARQWMLVVILDHIQYLWSMYWTLGFNSRKYNT